MRRALAIALVAVALTGCASRLAAAGAGAGKLPVKAIMTASGLYSSRAGKVS